MRKTTIYNSHGRSRIWDLGIRDPYFEFAKERSSGRLGAGLGAGIGIWNLGISSLQGALGAGIGIWNLVISSSQVGPWGPGLELESGNFEFASGGPGGAGTCNRLPPPTP